MNVQIIQIMILLLDGLIKMAPWRFGPGEGKNLARSLRLTITVFAGL